MNSPCPYHADIDRRLRNIEYILWVVLAASVGGGFISAAGACGI